MIRLIMPLLVLSLVFSIPADLLAADRVHPHAMTICSIIINEMTEGRISQENARQISLAIAQAGNRHFGRVTCGDMWLYMAMVYIESGFRNNIVNPLNCRGMFQVHAPSWARKFGRTYTDLLDLHINADSGIRVFKYYLDLYGKIVPALSAYNSDDPRASVGYARAVLGARQRIKKRYTELYRDFQDGSMVAFNPNVR